MKNTVMNSLDKTRIQSLVYRGRKSVALFGSMWMWIVNDVTKSGKCQKERIVLGSSCGLVWRRGLGKSQFLGVCLSPVRRCHSSRRYDLPSSTTHNQVQIAKISEFSRDALHQRISPWSDSDKLKIMPNFISKGPNYCWGGRNKSILKKITELPRGTILIIFDTPVLWEPKELKNICAKTCHFGR
jgi:hypothetical protein